MNLSPTWRVVGTALLASSIFAAPAVRAGAGVMPVRQELPLVFEPNHGQTDAHVQYLSRGGSHALLLQQREAVLVLRSKDNRTESVRMRFDGAGDSQIKAETPLSGHSNYLIGNDRSQWQTNIPHFAKVRYQSVYPGIDLIYYGNEGQLEYDFIVAAGADPSRIRFRLDGAKNLRLASNGDLVLALDRGEARHHKPVVYQEIAGVRTPVDGRYVLRGNQVSFALGNYDRTQPLIIDPILNWGGYIGGLSADAGQAIAVDAQGAAYITGQTQSVTGFPLVNAFQSTHGGSAPIITDAFITKINSAGTGIAYSTYLGGNAVDTGSAIAVNAAGEAFVTGDTNSTNFPTASPLRATLSGLVDVFLVKLNASGNALLYSSYLGGSATESAKGVAVDGTGAMYISGFTTSTNLPNLLAGQALSGETDGFVMKLTSTGQQVLFSTYVGGSLLDYVLAMAVDANQNIYVTGRSTSTNLPQSGGFQAGNAGEDDAFVCKLNSAGARVYWTYIGGAESDAGRSIAVDSAGAAFVGGDTSSTNFPVTAGAFQTTLAGGIDVFAVKLNPSGAALDYATYIGGSSSELGYGIAINSSGHAYLTGHTVSANFPVVSSVKASEPGAFDAFVIKLAPNGAKAVYSTLAGGSSADTSNAIAVDSQGSAYITGLTLSTNISTIPGNAFSGSQDAFFMKFSDCSILLTPASVSLGAASQPGSFAVQPQQSGCQWTAFTTDPFIQLSGTTSGSGPGTVNYTIQANGGAQRSGSIVVEGASFTITQAGSGTAPSSAPYTIDVVPASGSGNATTFTARYGTARPTGALIERAYILINSAISASGSCFIEYTASSNTFRLIQDGGVNWNTPVAPGAATTTSNSQCTLNAAGASATSSIPTMAVSQLALVLPVTFSSSFTGPKNIYLLAVNETYGLNSGWEQKGTWSVTQPPPPAGQVGVGTLTPSNGSGASGTFTSTFTHAGGATQHYLGYTLFLPTPNVVRYTATGSCLVEYNRISHGMRLIDNAGTGWLGGESGIRLGTPGAVLTNNQCSVNVYSALGNVNGNTMTVRFDVNFKNAMGPVLGTFLQALDVNENWTGMTQMGNWFLPGAPQTRPGPSIVSLTPAAVTGSSATYTMSATHTSGASALIMLHLRVSAAVDGQTACQAVYFPSNNSLNLINATGTDLVSPVSVTVGTGTTLSNGLCTINTAGAASSRSAGVVTVALPMSFNPSSFGGAKKVYSVAFDNTGLLTHWVQGGTITIQ